VVKNKHYLPATGALRDTTTPIYTKRVRLRNVESLLVLPLLCADEAIGTFTLAATAPNRFNKDVREMLRIIANQVAVSLQNAGMYKRMETMATTDGLTGLTNHRTFQERAADLLERSARHGHKAAVLLTDVDHFKKVNDNYGHPVGDEVLRRVAGVLAGRSRKVDIVARYGGEEFCLVLPDTDAAGAEHFANELRQEIADQVMTSEHGKFRVTISMGVAQFPQDSTERTQLIERADQALYACKEGGRNCVRRFAQLSG
jgi:diguanylate cyclase (GGDEF)-like protein